MNTEDAKDRKGHARDDQAEAHREEASDSAPGEAPDDLADAEDHLNRADPLKRRKPRTGRPGDDLQDYQA